MNIRTGYPAPETVNKQIENPSTHPLAHKGDELAHGAVVLPAFLRALLLVLLLHLAPHLPALTQTHRLWYRSPSPPPFYTALPAHHEGEAEQYVQSAK